MTSPIITLDFNAGAEGAALAAGGDIAAVVDTHTYAAAAALHGARGITATGSTTAPTFTVNKSASFVDANGDWTISLYQRPITVPGGAIQTLVIRNSANSILGQVRFHSDGKIDVAAGSTRAASSTLTWSANTWHRLDISFVASTRNTTVKIFKGANVEGTTPDETIAAVINTQTGGVQNWLFSAARATTAGAQSDLDTIRIYDGIVTPAPFNPPPTGSTATVTHHWLGAPTRTGFKVKAKISGGTSCRLAVSTVVGMTSPTYTAAVAPDADGYVALTVTGLTAGTRYYYQIEDTPSGGSATLVGAVGRARTLPAGDSHSIALAACITTGAADSTALDDIVTWDPDALIFTGDFHYASGTQTTEAEQRGQLETQINSAAGLKALLRDVPWGAYAFSDHEAGPDNGDSNNAYTAATIEAYKHIVPYYSLADSRTPTVGRYHSFVIGRVRYIVLDIRNTDRSPGAGVDGVGKTMLGATQKAWLKAELIQAEPVKVIVSDVAWLGPASITNGEDKWWSYATERQEIADYITTNGVRALLWHGDSHSLAVCTPANNDWGGFPVYCAAPLHNTGGGRNLGEFSAYWNNAGGNVRGYGRIEVVDSGSQIQFQFVGWDAAAGVQRVTQTDTFLTTVRVRVGPDPVSRVYVGPDQVSRIYVGPDQVWP